jgi:hypothetical protein
MTRRCLAALLVAGLATAAAAQHVAIDVFLEQRVAEELAADGTILSRLGVALDVEIVGDKTIVSLVDPSTRRAVASTKVDKLPADREAAVATVTQVAANLATQLSGNNSTAAAVKTVLEDERRHREMKEQAEAAYKREAITFNDITIVTSDGKRTSTGIAMIAYRGDRRLSVPEFFDAVDRHDLSEQFYRRRNFGLGALVVGTGAMIAGAIMIPTKGVADHEFGTCSILSPNYDSCQAAEDMRNDARDRDASRWLKISLGIAIGGAIVGGIGYYYIARANPIDEHQAHDMADAHNAKLRSKHGLPSLSQRKTARGAHVALVPHASESGGGLTLVGRF